MPFFPPFNFRQKHNYKTANMCNSTDSAELSYLEVEHLPPSTDGVVLRQNSSRLKCCIVISVLVISFFLNVIMFCYIWKHRPQEERTHAPYTNALVSAVHRHSVCTDCVSLGVHPESIDAYRGMSIHYLSDEIALCCMNNAEGLWRLASMPLHKQFVKSTRKTSANENTSGAHLYIDATSLKLTPPKLSWSREYGYGSAYSSVPTDDKNIHITKPGLYYIYSFITFKTHERRQEPNTVIHTISRRNGNLPHLGRQMILIDKTTLPEESEKFLTSYLSATVRLRQEDQLFVQVSNLSYVYRFAPSNFFGLYLVGE